MMFRGPSVTRCLPRALLSLLLTIVPALAQDEPEAVGPPGSAPPAFEVLDPSGLRLRVDPIDDCSHVALWLALGSGAAHDPVDRPGLARVVGEVLRDLLPEPTAGRPTDVQVLARATLLGVTVPVAELPRVVALFGKILGGGIEPADEVLERARDRALLRLDDERHVLPGPVLRGLAGTALRPTDPDQRRPDPLAVAELGLGDLRRAMEAATAPQRAWLAVLGGSVDSVATIAEAFAGLEPSDVAAPEIPRLPPPAESPAHRLVSRHVDAPFVVAAIPAPQWGEEGYLPFLIGMEAMRVRAYRVLGTVRGGEVRAEFAPFFWDPLLDQRFAFVERRGADEDDVTRVEQELKSFLAGFRAGGASIGEVQQAMGLLLRGLELPPPSDPALLQVLRRQPAVLHTRGRVPILYTLHGWPTDLRHAFEGIQMHHVHEVLRQRLEADSTVMLALQPDRD